MRFYDTIIKIIVLTILIFSCIVGKGQEIKSSNLDLLHNPIIAPLSYSKLFEVKKYYSVSQRKIQSFNFLKDYQVDVYDVTKWYVNNNTGAIPCIITYYDPVMMCHLDQKHIIIKEKKQ